MPLTTSRAGRQKNAQKRSGQQSGKNMVSGAFPVSRQDGHITAGQDDDVAKAPDGLRRRAANDRSRGKNTKQQGDCRKHSRHVQNGRRTHASESGRPQKESLQYALPGAGKMGKKRQFT
jgi:hypothetical protein